MTVETQTPEIDDTLSHDDIDVLRAVLQANRGIAPVAVYNQTDFDSAE